MTNAAIITITETATPSRSKGRGWCYIQTGGENSRVFASAAGRTIEAEIGATIKSAIGVELRRKTRTDKERAEIAIIVTGNEDDVVTISLGSPQSYDARITGARRVEA
jgi:hypothetical protein